MFTRVTLGSRASCKYLGVGIGGCSEHICKLEMTTSAIKKFGDNKVKLMLVGSSTPQGWSTETLLMRWVEQNGNEVVFVLNDQAIPGFSACEKWRVYELEFKGKCVKTVPGTKYGSNSPQEVHMKFPGKVTVAKDGFPVPLSYDFQDLKKLSEKTKGDFVDIFGIVIKTPAIDVTASLPKMPVSLGQGDVAQNVDFLGEHAVLSLKVGDRVALRAARIHEYLGVKTVQTAYLTVIEINPAKRTGIPEVPDLEDGPKKKAIKLTHNQVFTIEEAKQKAVEMQKLADGGDEVPTCKFCLPGNLEKFTKDFFEKDPPLLEMNGVEKMCWITNIQEGDHSIEAKVWHKPCADLFEFTPETLRKLWEKGLEHEGEQDDILKEMNAALDTRIKANCTLKVWTYGYKTKINKIQLNVDDAEFMSDSE